MTSRVNGRGRGAQGDPSDDDAESVNSATTIDDEGNARAKKVWDRKFLMEDPPYTVGAGQNIAIGTIK
jgi:hypothetical protein